LTPESFVAALADVRLPSVFNPYLDNCNVFDRADAASRRRRNLEKFLVAVLAAKVQTIWIARDLGYRGGRRTGVPLTDEVHLDSVAKLFGGITLQRATKGPLVAERTAAIVWRVIASIDQPVMLWNVFPFHPHESDDPFSNRCHTRSEREVTLPLLQALIEMIQPTRVVAIGRDAQLALVGLDAPVVGVRHPSYGGQSEFISGVQEIYGVSEAPKGQLSMINSTQLC
jgi:uracil-DNA glycosylase